MQLFTHTLGNDVTLRIIPCEKFTSNYLSFQFAVPLRRETAAKYALLSLVMKRGCVSYPTQELLAKRLEELYGAELSHANSQTGEIQILTFSMDMLDNRFSYDGTDISKSALALLKDIVIDPLVVDGAFKAEYVAREKEVLIDRINAAINNKNSYALKRCREIMCEKEAYSVSLLGTVEDVAAITPKELYEAYLQLLAEAKIMICYIGREAPARLMEQLGDLNDGLRTRAPRALQTEFVPAAQAIKRVEETVNAVQGKLTMGFRLGCSNSQTDSTKILVMNAVFGSSTVSKLFMNVREKLSLCYYCSSTVDSFKGVMYVYSGIENCNVQKAEEEILHQLSEMQAGRITEDELACAKQYIRSTYQAIADSPTALENWYKNRAIIGDTLSPDEAILQIDCVTVAELTRLSQGITLDTVYFLRGTATKNEEEDTDEN